MATVTHYIRSHYNPKDRELLEVATGQVPSHPEPQHAEEPEDDPWQTEYAFGSERRLAAAPRFVTATVSYDEVNNMLGGASRPVPVASHEPPKSDVGGWYRSLTKRANAPELGTGTSQIANATLQTTHEASWRQGTGVKKHTAQQLRLGGNNWFITRALQSEPSSIPHTPPPPTLADILEREPPISKQPIQPPVFLALGPSNKGWGMLQRNGWSEGEGLGANIVRHSTRREEKQKQQLASSSKTNLSSNGVAVKMENQERPLDEDGEVTEMRAVEVVDLTLSDSEVDESEGNEDDISAVSNAQPSTSLLRDSSPHSKPLLTPIPTILKSDRLGIGLKAKREGPYRASKKRVTHNQSALATHIRATEEMRKMKALVGRGSRGFARMAKAESDQRRQLLASLNES
jgi:hypothetical protein